MRSTDLDELRDIREFATQRQQQYIDAVLEAGNQSKAAELLQINRRTLERGLESARKFAAKKGYAPGQWQGGTAPGFSMRKVTTHHKLNPNTNEFELNQYWGRQHEDEVSAVEAIQEWIEDHKALIEPIPAITPNRPTRRDLLNLYTFTDCHVGMLASLNETGNEWDLEIARETLLSAFEEMISTAPDASKCIINQLGDFFHADSLAPVTPTSGHVVDAAARFKDYVRVGIEILTYMIDTACRHHDEVEVLMAEGNHDIATSYVVGELLKERYRNNPQVKVMNNDKPYYATIFGKTLLGFHHGHLTKKDKLPAFFAQEFRQLWGQTEHAHIHCGHYHHLDEKEDNGATVLQHPTLTAADAYSARYGYHSLQRAMRITYHREYTGEYDRRYISPEMFRSNRVDVE